MANINRSQPPLHNTFGREPTTNVGGKKGKEGNTSVTGLTSEDADAVIERSAKGFRNDVVKRSQRVRGKRGKRARD